MWLSGRAFALHVKGPGFDPRHLQMFLQLMLTEKQCSLKQGSIFSNSIVLIHNIPIFVKHALTTVCFGDVACCGYLKNQPLRAGFEPAREDPIGFRVQRLNHSAITALC